MDFTHSHSDTLSAVLFFEGTGQLSLLHWLLGVSVWSKKLSKLRIFTSIHNAYKKARVGVHGAHFEQVTGGVLVNRL